jgi:hypothetical protein
MYRIVLKLCAKSICFQTVNTDGVMVIANPPVTGGITVEHLNTTQTGSAEIIFAWLVFVYFYTDCLITTVVNVFTIFIKYIYLTNVALCLEKSY